MVEKRLVAKWSVFKACDENVSKLRSETSTKPRGIKPHYKPKTKHYNIEPFDIQISQSLVFKCFR